MTDSLHLPPLDGDWRMEEDEPPPPELPEVAVDPDSRMDAVAEDLSLDDLIPNLEESHELEEEENPQDVAWESLDTPPNDESDDDEGIVGASDVDFGEHENDPIDEGEEGPEALDEELGALPVLDEGDGSEPSLELFMEKASKLLWADHAWTRSAEWESRNLHRVVRVGADWVAAGNKGAIVNDAPWTTELRILDLACDGELIWAVGPEGLYKGVLESGLELVLPGDFARAECAGGRVIAWGEHAAHEWDGQNFDSHVPVVTAAIDGSFGIGFVAESEGEWTASYCGKEITLHVEAVGSTMAVFGGNFVVLSEGKAVPVYAGFERSPLPIPEVTTFAFLSDGRLAVASWDSKERRAIVSCVGMDEEPRIVAAVDGARIEDICVVGAQVAVCGAFGLVVFTVPGP